MADLRSTQEIVEALVSGVSDARLTQQVVEIAHIGNPQLFETQHAVEVLLATIPRLRSTQEIVEVLHNVPPPENPVESVSNTLSLSQAVIVGMGRDISVESTLTLTNFAFNPKYFDSENTLTLTDELLVAKQKSIDPVEHILTLAQDVLLELILNRAIYQGLVLKQSVNLTIRRDILIEHMLNLDQDVSAVLTIPATNTLVLAQEATVEFSKARKNTLVLTQLATRSMTFNRAFLHPLTINHVAVAVKTANRALTGTLALSQSVIVQNVKKATSVLTLTQSATYVVAKLAKNSLVLNQAVTVTRTTNKSLSNTLNLAQSVRVSKSVQKVASNALGLIQTASIKKIKALSASNTLVITGDMTGDRTAESISHDLELTQSVSSDRLADRSVASMLALAQTLELSKTQNLSAGNTLTFLDYFNKETGFGTTKLPPVQVVKVYPIVVLTAGNFNITLPKPEFGNTLGLTSQVNVKRTMDGGTRLYKRSQVARRLSYTFLLDRPKALELRQFILATAAEQILLTNWIGEIWLVKYTVNPFTFAEISVRTTITLEFEGVRLN